jgi:hypothetical protein
MKYGNTPYYTDSTEKANKAAWNRDWTKGKEGHRYYEEVKLPQARVNLAIIVMRTNAITNSKTEKILLILFL